MEDQPTTEPTDRDLRVLHRAVVEAFVTRDAAFVAAIARADFRMLASDGARVDRAGLPASLAGGSSPGVLEALAEVHVRRFGTSALVHALVETGASRQRRTDVFAHDGARWQLVSVQLTPLREGVSATLQRGTVPPHAPWRGEDPAGDDDTVLRRLNERYVQSFRECDVGWYDAHLAPDYLVTNGDGSFVDRAGALAAFARPVFATQMRSFPVDQVHICRCGELALIEAENAYEMKDGRTGVSRYTDIWREAAGRWACVAAHITVVRAP